MGNASSTDQPIGDDCPQPPLTEVITKIIMGKHDEKSHSLKQRINLAAELQDMTAALKAQRCPWHRTVPLQNHRKGSLLSLTDGPCPICSEEYCLDLDKVITLKKNCTNNMEQLSEGLVTVYVEASGLSQCNKPEIIVANNDTILSEEEIDSNMNSQELKEISTALHSDCFLRGDDESKLSGEDALLQRAFLCCSEVVQEMGDDEESIVIDEVDLDNSMVSLEIDDHHNHERVGTYDRNCLENLQENCLESPSTFEGSSAQDQKLTIESPIENDGWALFLSEDDVNNQYAFRRNVSYMDSEIFRLLLTYEFLRHRSINCQPYISPMRRSAKNDCSTKKTQVTMIMTMISDGSSGTTSLIKRYMEGRFEESKNIQRGSVEKIEFYSRCFENFPCLSVRLDIQDISGVSASSWGTIQRAHCVVVVISVDQELECYCFREMKQRLQRSQDVIVCLNKVDLPANQWLFTRHEFYTMIRPYQYRIIETSAAHNLNVEELFYACACSIYENKNHKQRRSEEPLIPLHLRFDINK